MRKCRYCKQEFPDTPTWSEHIGTHIEYWQYCFESTKEESKKLFERNGELHRQLMEEKDKLTLEIVEKLIVELHKIRKRIGFGTIK